MQYLQRMRDNNGYQVALFPLPGFSISQTDYGTFSHHGGEEYWATDYLAIGSNGQRLYRQPCFAPVDIKCVFINQAEAMAVWESTERVHLANGMIDYLTITCYHDNDIENGTYPYRVGQVINQGYVFFKTGTGGTATGDHLHLETGYGRYLIPQSTARYTAEYKFHITDYTSPKRLHNYNALFINDTSPIDSPEHYIWMTFSGGGGSTIYKKKFPWVLYSKKLRNRRNS